jgi:hypothetical protein
LSDVLAQVARGPNELKKDSVFRYTNLITTYSHTLATFVTQGLDERLFMRRKLVCISAALSILLVFSATCALSTAVTYSLGVTTGTTADYSASVTNQNTDKMSLNVKSTSGTELTVLTTYHYSNGTTKSRTDTWDVSNGPGSNASLALSLEWLKIVSANLSKNDILYSGTTGYINSTTSMSVGGQTRTVNLWNVSHGYLVIYWDKPTGLMVKISLYLGPIYGWSNYTMTSTSLWSNSSTGNPFGLSTTTLILIGGGALVVIAVLVILLRRR